MTISCTCYYGEILKRELNSHVLESIHRVNSQGENTAKEPDEVGMREFFVICNIILHLRLHLQGVFPSRCPTQQLSKNQKFL